MARGVAKELKLKVRKVLGLIPLFEEVAWEKLVGGLFDPNPSPPHPRFPFHIRKRVMVKQAQEARDNQFLFQNVQKMRFLRSSKCSKTIAELTFTTQKTNACFLLDWLSYSVVPFFGKFGSKTQIVSLS